MCDKLHCKLFTLLTAFRLSIPK